MKLFLELPDNEYDIEKIKKIVSIHRCDAIMINTKNNFIGTNSQLNDLKTITTIISETCQDVPFILNPNSEYVHKVGCNGVNFESKPTAEDFSNYRRILGNDGVIGIDTTYSKHDAMLCCELEPDYIRFPNIESMEHIEFNIWAKEVFNIMTVIRIPKDYSLLKELLNIEPEFIFIGNDLYTNEKNLSLIFEKIL